MGKHYDIWHSEDDLAWPFDLGLGSKYRKVDILIKETGKSSTGWGYTYEEALEDALEKLEEDDC